ncbi:hypothetical protein SAMN05443248_3937 [Bradyrhizobium erythrophlei]|uniref:Uncharacterized protein n=1 Tax=Bradyrhizobium erythrophlei TaxID=1437360 RepID=A0A1M5QT85_9BRAD|nr:hypothetical protein SAMN05443248_3937 [Bradyrhizobium erythrophlei]
MPKRQLIPRDHKTTRALVRANVNARPFALSPKRFYGGSPSLTTAIRNASRKRRPITLAEHA